MRFKKTTKKFYAAIMWIVGAIVTLGIAGLFIKGTFMNTFLGFLPLIVHQIVGWLIIIAFAFGVIGYALKMHRR